MAPSCSAFKFRKFTAAMLFSACIAGAAISVNTSENAEIAGFMVSESNRLLRLPSDAGITLTFQNARDKHGRVIPIFFLGQRNVSITAEYILSLPSSEQLKGTVKADTSWLTGYCGMIECRTKPMPALQRIDTLKALVQKIIAELNGKFETFPEPGSSNMATAAEPISDTIAEPASEPVAEPEAVPEEETPE